MSESVFLPLWNICQTWRLKIDPTTCRVTRFDYRWEQRSDRVHARVLIHEHSSRGINLEISAENFQHKLLINNSSSLPLEERIRTVLPNRFLFISERFSALRNQTEPEQPNNDVNFNRKVRDKRALRKLSIQHTARKVNSPCVFPHVCWVGDIWVWLVLFLLNVCRWKWTMIETCTRANHQSITSAGESVHTHWTGTMSKSVSWHITSLYSTIVDPCRHFCIF